MNKCYVYALSDPQTGDVRYVGQTSRSLRRRLTEHVQDIKRSKRYSSNWIRSLGDIQPLIELIEEFDDQIKCDEAEQFYIDYFRSLGFKLTNLTGGGKGVIRDVVVTDKMRETTRRTHLGVKRSDKTRAKISAARLGTKMPPRSQETRDKISTIHKGKTVAADSRVLMSKARGGKPVIHIESGLTFDTASEAARHFGVWPQGVSQCASGRIKHTAGHRFAYAQ